MRDKNPLCRVRLDDSVELSGQIEEGRSNLLGGPKRCFEGFVTSRYSLVINLDSELSLGAILRQFARKTGDALAESSEQN